MKEAGSAEVDIKEFPLKAASAAVVSDSFICPLARSDGSAPVPPSAASTATVGLLELPHSLAAFLIH